MRMKRIFACIFSAIALTAVAQEATVAADTINTTRTVQHQLRVGADLVKITRSLLEDDYQGWEIVGDLRLTKNLYLAAEIGNEDKFTEEDRTHFSTKGSYIKLGVDYNVYENWLDMNNQIYIGGRYGFSSFSQNLHAYKVYTTHPYFPNDEQWITTNAAYSGLNASWLEVIGGVKAEVLSNLYLGFSTRIHYLVHDKAPDNFENHHIPGFQRQWENPWGVSFNYSITYQIPLFTSKWKS